MCSVKVSLVVPVYNAEKYIERCAVSLFEQSLNEMEFIFVDDGSKDSTVSMIESVLSRYPMRQESTSIVRLDENKGLPNARMCGLGHASGEYIAFCDSDDWMDRTMCEKLYEKASSTDADIAYCGIHKVNDFGTFKTIIPKRSDNYLMSLMKGEIHAYMWNRIVRRSVFLEVLYCPEKNMWEDLPFSAQLLYYAKSFCHVDEALYYYYDNQTGLVNAASTKQKIQEMSINLSLAEDFIREKFAPQEAARYLDATVPLKFVIKTLAWTFPRKEYMGIYPEINVRAFFTKGIEFKKKLGHLTAMLGIHGLSKVLKK